MCFPSQIVRFFAEADNTELIDLSVSALTIFAFAYLFRWIGFSTQSFLLAIEKPAPATLISICITLVWRRPYLTGLLTTCRTGLELERHSREPMSFIGNVVQRPEPHHWGWPSSGIRALPLMPAASCCRSLTLICKGFFKTFLYAAEEVDIFEVVFNFFYAIF